MKFKDIKFAVAGGDMRMLVCARELAADGFETCYYGFDTGYGGGAVKCRSFADAVNGASEVILPVPYSSDGCRLNCPLTRSEIRVEELLSRLSVGQIILAGVCSPALSARAEELNLTLIDYMKDEELAVKNAVPTAEGAAELAIRELPATVHGAKVLILGYGRVGVACADVFSALRADVTVCARRGEQLAWAEVSGCKTAHINFLSEAVREAELIINTIPETVITAPVLNGVSRDALIIDLSSPPGGADCDYAAQIGVKVLRALSLPGKVAPVTAGRNIKATVLRLLQMRGIL